MNPFEMVVLIVAITAVASIFRAKYGYGGRRHRHDRDDQPVVEYRDPDADKMREELRILRDRIQVLERIVTDSDDRRSITLEREIEALRNQQK